MWLILPKMSFWAKITLSNYTEKYECFSSIISLMHLQKQFLQIIYICIMLCLLWYQLIRTEEEAHGGTGGKGEEETEKRNNP